MFTFFVQYLEIKNGYWLNSIVATNVKTVKNTKNGKEKKEIENIPLNLNLYSTMDDKFESQNRESMKSIDEVIKIIGNKGIWVMDRGYDRAGNIIKEMIERDLTFIIRSTGIRNVIREKNGETMKIKSLGDIIKTREEIIYFEYKINKNNEKNVNNKKNNNNKNEEQNREKQEKENQRMYGRVGYEEIRIPGINAKLYLCVLKKLNGELSMMMITNKEIKNIEDVIEVFSKYSSRWGVEDTYKYMKQEFGLEHIMLKKYKSLQNMMTFVLLAMNFVSSIRDRSEYLTRVLIEQARALNGKVLKYVEHSIIAGISYYLRLSSEGIRTFLKRKISKYYGGNNLSLFDNYPNPYEILGKL